MDIQLSFVAIPKRESSHFLERRIRYLVRLKTSRGIAKYRFKRTMGPVFASFGIPSHSTLPAEVGQSASTSRVRSYRNITISLLEFA